MLEFKRLQQEARRSKLIFSIKETKIMAIEGILGGNKKKNVSPSIFFFGASLWIIILIWCCFWMLFLFFVIFNLSCVWSFKVEATIPYSRFKWNSSLILYFPIFVFKILLQILFIWSQSIYFMTFCCWSLFLFLLSKYEGKREDIILES